MLKLNKELEFKVITPAPFFLPSSPVPDEEYNERVDVDWYNYIFPKKFQVLTDTTFMDCLKNRPWSIVLLPSFMLNFARSFLKNVYSQDIIHAYWSISAFFPVLFKKFHKKPIVLSLLGSDLNVFEKNMAKHLNNYIFKRVDCCVVLGKQQQKVLENRVKRIEVIPFGVDINYYYPISMTKKSELREKFNLPIDRIVISWVGRFSEEKGTNLFAPICENLIKLTNNKFIFVLIGEGSEKRHFFEEILEKQLDSYFIDAGNPPSYETSKWVQAADISISCSISEGLCTALCEAAHVELPIVATDVGEIETIVEDKVTGNIIKNRDVQMFSEALKDLIEKPELRKQMGVAARKRLEKLTCSNAAADTLKLYADLIQ